MKRIYKHFGFIFIMLLLTFYSILNKGYTQTTTVTYTTNGYFVAPIGVTSITVECWGGGGGGEAGTSTNRGGGGGGGGGGYSSSVITVTPGEAYPFVVGKGGGGGTATLYAADGGATYFINTTTLMANGGSKGGYGAPGAGGAGAALGVGTIRWAGGSGAAGTNANSSPGGGGGSSAGTGANGSNASGSTGGTAPAGGGNGGNGGVAGSINGVDGSFPGGGGGGGYSTSGTAGNGGKGADGQIRITYTCFTITTQPVNQTLCIGGGATFSVEGSVSGLNYQWQYNSGTWNNVTNGVPAGAVYSGANSSVLNVSGITAGGPYSYRCILSNACGSLTSNTATLTINAAAAPATPADPTCSSTLACSQLLTATGTPPGGVTWYWQGTSCGTTTALGSGPTYLATTPGTYSIRARNNVIGCWSLGCGSVTPPILEAPSIITQPSNTNACVGSPVSFFIEASGAGLTYQWQENGVNLSNTGVYSGVTTPTLTISNPAGLNGRTYSCIVTGGCAPPATSNTATLTVISAGLSGVRTVGTAGNYATLKAAFDAINANGLSGNLELQIISNITDNNEAILNQWTDCGGSSGYTVTIYPTGATRTLSGSVATSLITLNGADKVLIEGRLNKTGAAKSLIISNTNTSGSTIRFTNDACNNTIQYADIRGVCTSTSNGVIYFGTGSTTGNDNNIIQYCDIRDGATNPAVGIFALGDDVKLNNNNTIAYNNIYNFFLSANLSCGIYIKTGNTKWTIQGNSLYQTAARTNVIYLPIYVDNEVNGNDFIIDGNYIGGQAASCGGGAYTVTATAANYFFYGIQVRVTNSGITYIRNNVISNISWTGYPYNAHGVVIFAGMTGRGRTQMNNNTIGNNSTGSITVSIANASYYPIVSGIFKTGDGNILNNRIGSITITGALSSYYGYLYPIFIQGNLITDLRIDGNVIGNETTANSIQIGSGGTTPTIRFAGIRFGTAGNYRTDVTNNLIANVYCNLTGTTSTYLYGISNEATNGTQQIVGNTVRNMTSNSTNTGVWNPTTTYPTIAGIVSNNTTSGGLLISNNQIYSLFSNVASTVASKVYGICVKTPNVATNNISANLIKNIYSDGNDSEANGIYLLSGQCNINNNMISLGFKNDGATVSRGCKFSGIWHASPNAANYYFNSVYIGGTNSQTGTYSTYGFLRSINATIDLKNNIFYNARTNSAGSHKNFAIAVNSTTSLTSNYNILLSSVAADLGTQNYPTNTSLTFAGWQGGVRDMQSYNVNPLFVNPSGAPAAIDLHLQAASPAKGVGIAGTGILIDFDGQQRKTGVNPNGPCIGADEDFAPPLAKNAYGIYMPAPQTTATIADCEIYAVGGTPGGIGYKIANPNDAAYANVFVSSYQTITAENKSCTNIPIDFTSTTGSGSDWLFGNGAIPPLGIGSPFLDVTYGTIGRKDIIETVKIYKDFLNITMSAPSPGTILGPTSGCQGTYNYVSSVAGSAGFLYNWSVTAPGGCSASVATPTASSTDITFVNTTGYTQIFTIALNITTECCGPLSTVYLRVNVYPGPNAPVITGSPFSVCEGGTATVNLSAPDPVAGNTYNWYTEATGGTPILINNTFTFSPVTLGSTTYYCEAINSFGCPSTRTSFVITGVATPAPIVADVSVCGTGTATLTIQDAVAGYTYTWYSGSCGGTVLQTGLGNTYSTTVSATTTVYVNATPPGCGSSACAAPVINYVSPPGTIYWLGVIGGLNNWYEPVNWTSGCIPTSASDVIIVPNGGTVVAQPDIGFGASFGAAQCKSITLQNGSNLSFSDARADLEVYGDFNHDGTLTTNNMGRVTFKGSVAQAYNKTTGTGRFWNVLINNSSATGLTLNALMDITGSCNFNDGYIYSTATNILQFRSGATTSGASNNSFVSGPVNKVGTEAFIFPVGKSGIYAPIGIAASGASNTINAEYFFADPGNNFTVNGTLHHVSSTEYWVINRTAGSSYPDVTLYWYDGTRSVITDLAELRMAHYSGGVWNDMGGTTTGNVSVGTITNTIAFTSYSPVTFGSTQAAPINPLPVQLLKQNIICSNNEALIRWSTASETNNDKFIIEKSFDLNNWQVVAIKDGAGNSNEKLDYIVNDAKLSPVKTYYRIKSVDYSGKVYISDVMVSNCGILNTNLFQAYRYQLNDIKVEFTTETENENYTIVLSNVLGKVIKQVDVVGKSGVNEWLFKDLNLSPGVYMVSLIGKQTAQTKKVVIEY